MNLFSVSIFLIDLRKNFFQNMIVYQKSTGGNFSVITVYLNGIAILKLRCGKANT